MVRKKKTTEKRTSFRLNLRHRPLGENFHQRQCWKITWHFFFFTFLMIFVKTQVLNLNKCHVLKKGDVLESEVQSVSLSRILLPLRALSLVHVPQTPVGVGGGSMVFNHGLYSGNNFFKFGKRERVAEVPGRYQSVRLRVVIRVRLIVCP